MKPFLDHFEAFLTNFVAELNEKTVKAKKRFSYYVRQTTNKTIFLFSKSPADINSLINYIKPNKSIDIVVTVRVVYQQAKKK